MKTLFFCGLLKVLLCLYYVSLSEAMTYRELDTATTDSDDGMAAFCQYTPILRRKLANKLPLLQASLSSAMHPLERRERTSGAARTISAFAEQQTLSSLRRDAQAAIKNMRCMGRALDVHRNSDPSPLYPAHMLPFNARQLHSEKSFQLRFRHAFRQLQDLAARADVAAMSGSGFDAFGEENLGRDDDDDSEGACLAVGWNNPSYILILSHASVEGSRRLLEDVSQSCRLGYNS